MAECTRLCIDYAIKPPNQPGITDEVTPWRCVEHDPAKPREESRLEIALAVCDGVLRTSITVAKPTT